MENEPQRKKLKQTSDVSKCRLEVSDKLKEIINCIDLDAESILIKLNDQTHIDRINTHRNILISEIQRIINKNLENIDRISETSKIKSRNQQEFLIENCAYLDLNYLEGFVLENDRLGILIVWDLSKKLYCLDFIW